MVIIDVLDLVVLILFARRARLHLLLFVCVTPSVSSM